MSHSNIYIQRTESKYKLIVVRELVGSLKFGIFGMRVVVMFTEFAKIQL